MGDEDDLPTADSESGPKPLLAPSEAEENDLNPDIPVEYYRFEESREYQQIQRQKQEIETLGIGQSLFYASGNESLTTLLKSTVEN